MTKDELIGELKEGGYLKTPAIIEAVRRVDRKDFVPREYEEEAYANYPLSIGFGQTISQPLTVVFMLELLAPAFGERVLEVGAGSGWQTALLAYLVGEGSANGVRNGKRKKPGKVCAIERLPALREMAAQNVSRYNFIGRKIAEVILGDGSLGYPPGAPYHKIVAAATSDRIRVAWKEQLAVGGRIVAPVGTAIRVLDKLSTCDFNERSYAGFSFVPLVTEGDGNGPR